MDSVTLFTAMYPTSYMDFYSFDCCFENKNVFHYVWNSPLLNADLRTNIDGQCISHYICFLYICPPLQSCFIQTIWIIWMMCYWYKDKDNSNIFHLVPSVRLQVRLLWLQEKVVSYIWNYSVALYEIFWLLNVAT